MATRTACEPEAGRQTIEEALEAAKAVVGGLRELMKRDRTSLSLLPRPGAKDSAGCTPLHLAVYRNDAATVLALLNAEADPNARDDYEETPLHWAIKNIRESLPVVVALLDAGADPNARDGEGEIPLGHAADRNDLAAFTVLLNAGAEPNYYAGETLLHSAVQYAVGWNDLTFVNALLKAGADPNAENHDDFGRTPLHWAAASDEPIEQILPVVKALRAAGADPYVEDDYQGWTPVQCAGEPASGYPDRRRHPEIGHCVDGRGSLRGSALGVIQRTAPSSRPSFFALV